MTLLPACKDAEPTAPRFLLGGIQVNEADDRVWLDALESHGMNAISVTDYARQGAWDSDDLRWAEDDPGPLAEIRAAKKRGFGVVLIARIALDPELPRNRFLWHGMVLPRGEDALRSWFERYTGFVLKWAEIAEREGIDVLMIGSELNALASTVPLEEVPALEEYYLNEGKQEERKAEVLRHAATIDGQDAWAESREDFGGVDGYLDARIANERAWARQVSGGSLEELNRRRRFLEERWLELIRTVRGVYGGALGYAANFDQFQDVGFWPHLDVMGINAYFKLRRRPLPPGADEASSPAIQAELEQGWRDALGSIQAFRAGQGLGEQPVIFTEMGYTYRLNSTLEPWADEGFSVIRFTDESAPRESPDAPPPQREQVVVWRDQPLALWERALAVQALDRVHRELEAPFLRGILYWKLSTIASHRDVESFVVLLDQDDEDPVLAELRRFLDPPAPLLPLRSHPGG